MEAGNPLPETIGRFHVIEAIGEGAMSIVYKAFDPEINRTLAIKVLRGECAADPEYRYRFVQEAKAAGKLTHPNIVTIFDVGEAEAGPYIAMEYLEGPTLDKLMLSGQRVSIREAVIYGIQLAEALDYSHARGIVHRDVKPSNIISLGERDGIRITDFGIAHMETAGTAQRTIMGTVLGTPQYMSPEQIEGLPVDGRSDLFSLGVILYQLITGEKPFTSATLTSLLLQIVKEDPVPLVDKVGDVPQSLQKIVAKLLAKKPEQRFQTGQELAQQLRRVVHEIDEREQHGSEARILPLRIMWTAVMVIVVSVAMILGSYLVYHKQVETMIGLALDSGGSLAQFIAVESVESLLIEDWVALESFVHEVQERQQISYLRISDHKRIVRASTDPAEVGRPLEQNGVGRVLRQDKDLLTMEREEEGVEVFDFKVPLLFQNKLIGNVQLGISRDALNGAANLTFYTMLLLLVAVVLTVAIVAYLLAARITLPIRRLKNALSHVRHGGLNHRIKTERNDEFGLLFSEYNRMADALLQAQEALEQKLAEAQSSQPQIVEAVAAAQEAPVPEQQEDPEPDVDSLVDDGTRILPPKNRRTGLAEKN
ncbi:MAG: protein kinase [Candidatus Thiodiazotropha sp.]